MLQQMEKYCGCGLRVWRRLGFDGSWSEVNNYFAAKIATF